MKNTVLKLGSVALAIGMTSAHAALDLYQPANNNTENLVWTGHMSQIQTQWARL
ncbi:hypothetical protein JCM19236_2625 [Vibrio sp. JCM 19236]|nr:hypothetical protein JCM19236_2625 [Vibrio sp. JCM 19236]